MEFPDEPGCFYERRQEHFHHPGVLQVIVSMQGHQATAGRNLPIPRPVHGTWCTRCAVATSWWFRCMLSDNQRSSTSSKRRCHRHRVCCALACLLCLVGSIDNAEPLVSSCSSLPIPRRRPLEAVRGSHEERRKDTGIQRRNKTIQGKGQREVGERERERQKTTTT